MARFLSLLLLAPALLMAPSVHAQITEKSAAKLPASVVALMPARTLDIATYRIAPAPGEPQLLVHLWSAPRRNPNAGGTFHAPQGFYQGKVTREEAQSFDSLYSSPFVYDIFTSDSRGSWNYMNSIIINDTSAPSQPTVRYLNNKTKQGYIFETHQFGGQYIFPATLYVFTDKAAAYFTRDITGVSPPARAGSRHFGFGRDARGYAQLIRAESGYDAVNARAFQTRTLFNWDENKRDWVAGQPVEVEPKGR